MKKLGFLLIMFFGLALGLVPSAKAQCAMCSISAEQGSKNGNTQTKGINDGVLFLLAAPFVLIAGVGGLWYFKYHKDQSIAQ
jgi:hypothetical protein